MLSGGAVADVSPSLLSLKPRQVLLAEQQLQKKRSSTSMGKKNPAQLKPEQESILTCTVALWLENKGFSKVLKRFLSAAQIEEDDWKANALNLNEIFSKYQEISKHVCEDLIPQKKGGEPALGTAEKNGVEKSMAHEDIENKKKKKTNKGEVASTDNGKTSADMEVDGEVKKPCVNGKEDKVLKEFNNEKVFEFTASQSDKPQKEKKKKKSKLTLEDKKKKKSKSTLESLNVKENQKDVEADVNEEIHKGSLLKSCDTKMDSEVIVEPKDKKKKKKTKGSLLDADKDSDLVKNTVAADKDATTSSELPPSGTEFNNKSKKRSAEAAEDEADKPKKASKKRKLMAPDENENQTGVEVATEESKPKNIKGLEERNDNAKSGRKQNGNLAEPGTVKAFQRVKVEEVKFADERLQDNSYWAKDGAEIGYGAKAQEVLGQVRGRDFRHEKTKKKRGSYRGGIIDLQSHSIKFDNSDDE